MLRGRLLGGDDYEEFSPIDKIFNAIIIILTVLMLSAIFVKEVWLKPYLISGTSMERTLQSDDWVLADALKAPKRGDVVIIYNRRKEVMLVKRVIALPGDVIRYDQNGAVYDKTDDGYTKREEDYALIKTNAFPVLSEEITVGEGEVFVMGDNRGVSEDSRRWGAMLISDIKGVVSQWVIDNRKTLRWIYPYV